MSKDKKGNIQLTAEQKKLAEQWEKQQKEKESEQQNQQAKLQKMAEEATEKYARAQDDGAKDSKPYDEKYYGQLSDIGEFKKKHKLITEKILEKAGGKYISKKQSHNVFWKPKSKVFTKQFAKRFPNLAQGD